MSAADSVDVLIVLAAGARLAVPVAQISRLVSLEKDASAAAGPSSSLAGALGLSPGAEPARKATATHLVTLHDGRAYGVDGVADLLSLPLGSIHRMPSVLVDPDRGLFGLALLTEGAPLLLLDLERLKPSRDAETPPAHPEQGIDRC